MRQHDFVLAVDECYAEIYDQDLPPGLADAVHSLQKKPAPHPDPFANLLIFTFFTLEAVQRTRFVLGLCGGDARLIDLMLQGDFTWRRCNIALSAATALWRDEGVHAMRADAGQLGTRTKTSSAHPGFTPAAAGFFFWLKVGDGEAATTVVARRRGARHPGYMGGPDQPITGINPGDPPICLSPFVHSPEITDQALARIATVLAASASASLSSPA